MKNAFFKFFSVISLILAIGILPWATCNCHEPTPEQHACCPRADHGGGNPQQADQKEPCCQINCLPKSKFQDLALEKTSPTFPLTLALHFNSALPEVGLVHETELSNSNHYDPGPSRVFLEHHSLLL